MCRISVSQAICIEAFQVRLLSASMHMCASRPASCRDSICHLAVDAQPSIPP